MLCGMKWNDLSDEHCSLARAVSIIGDRWTLLILREAFLRARRFEDYRDRLGIARRVLTERLAKLVEAGVLEKRVYCEQPLRHEYRLTDMGRGLYPAILSLVHWGDQWLSDGKGPPMIHHHLTCGHDFRSVLTCSECGDAVDPRAVSPRAA
jgi:DNA-binding HxlR family transcriptional regulator